MSRDKMSSVGSHGSDLIDAARRGAGTRWPGPGSGLGGERLKICW